MKEKLKILLRKWLYSLMRFLDSKLMIPSAKFYPMNHDFKPEIGEAVEGFNTKKKYFPFFYEEIQHPGFFYGFDDYLYMKTQLIPGQEVTGNKAEVECAANSILPFALKTPLWENPNHEMACKISQEGNEVKSKLTTNRYYFLHSKESRKLKFEASTKLILGDAWNLDQFKPAKGDQKLVLFLLLDSLGSILLEDYSLSEIMPQTADFFEAGTIFKNCYVNSEWTIPSCANILSSRYTIAHDLIHNTKRHTLHQDSRLVSQFYQDQNFFTMQFCGSPRKNPWFGYSEGFHNSIYQFELSQDQILSHFFDQMRTFKDYKTFAMLSLFDLHHRFFRVPSLKAQSQYDLNCYDFSKPKGKSVHDAYDDRRTKQYLAEVADVDTRLGRLFQYVLDNYSEDEFTIALCSDHGVQFIGEEQHILSRQMTQTPLMLRGSNWKGGYDERWLESVDILPTLLASTGTDFDYECHGKSFFDANANRDAVFMESVYPGRVYQAVLRSPEYVFQLKTKSKIKHKGEINLAESDFVLLDANVRETLQNQDLQDSCLERIKSHVSPYL